MLRKEQFALGAALVASALAFILSKSLAWFVLFIGLGLIFDFYFRDLMWGTDKLTREDIEKMPAEEYKERVLRNPKTERWVNWIASGRAAFRKHMRKLAREAVVFILLTPLITLAAAFIDSYHNAHKNGVLVVAELVPSGLPAGSHLEPIPCQIGEAYVEENRVIWTCQNGVRTPVITKFPSTLDLMETTAPVALYGIPIGFGLWLLYRAIRFAIKG